MERTSVERAIKRAAAVMALSGVRGFDLCLAPRDYERLREHLREKTGEDPDRGDQLRVLTCNGTVFVLKGAEEPTMGRVERPWIRPVQTP